MRVLEAERPAQAIVFVRTKIRCDQLYRTLRDKGMNVKALHGDMSQGARDGVMISFKDGRVPILVATDVAARGLDISTVTHIINFDVPTSPDVYVHRIGRTGRVGRSGRAITFVEPRQKRDLEAIERHANTKISPWAEGAHVGPAGRGAAPAPPPQAARRHARQRRRRLPQADRAGGRAAGLAEADLIAAVTARPASTARRSATCGCSSASRCWRCRRPTRERVVGAVDGTDVRGHKLRARARQAALNGHGRTHVTDDDDHEPGHDRVRDVRRRRPQDRAELPRAGRARASTTA